jgi:hypothetical protein
MAAHLANRTGPVVVIADDCWPAWNIDGGR